MQHLPDVVEAVGPSGECRARLRLADLWREGFVLSIRDIRRVRDDQVERACDAVEIARLLELDATCDIMPLRIGACHRQRRRRDISGDDSRAREFRCDRDRQAAAAGADVGDRHERHRHGLFDDELRLRPGNEHRR